eukprot:TRINITY_DN1768_c0_g1_i1.p1 TRINITY_DN1768_c0_g1~~TRINITY_DN1768_c0_g1_i1.p1  ORF type:complete len:336 (-),score=38.41 TRINITY_DN1768_c0_g1_i1:215-1222(-)
MRFGEIMFHSLISTLVCDAVLYDVGDLHGASSSLPCEALAPDECTARIGCRYDNKQCSVRIAWLHVMKTASSFGTVLAHHANASLPRDAHIPSLVNKSDPEDMAARPMDNKNKHLVRDFFRYKYPVETWFKGVFRNSNGPGDHVPIMDKEWEEWKGYWVGVFRQPEERVSSAFHHFAQGKGDILAFQKAVEGQQASMLSLGEAGSARVECERKGGGQNGPAPMCRDLKEPVIWRALSRLKDFAFVGILEEFDLSVCLFHVIYKSECLPVEFENIRPTKYHESIKSQKEEEDRLKQHPDPWDTPLYEAALHRFKGDLAQYNVNNKTCRKVCPGGPF